MTTLAYGHEGKPYTQRENNDVDMERGNETMGTCKGSLILYFCHLSYLPVMSHVT